LDKNCPDAWHQHLDGARTREAYLRKLQVHSRTEAVLAYLQSNLWPCGPHSLHLRHLTGTALPAQLADVQAASKWHRQRFPGCSSPPRAAAWSGCAVCQKACPAGTPASRFVLGRNNSALDSSRRRHHPTAPADGEVIHKSIHRPERAEPRLVIVQACRFCYRDTVCSWKSELN